MARQYIIYGACGPLYVNDTRQAQEILACVYLNETTAAEEQHGGTDRREVRLARRRRKLVHLSDLDERERLEALAELKARMQLPVLPEVEAVPVPEEEDDDVILLALTRLLH